MRIKGKLTVLVGVLAITMVAAACGGDDDGGNGDTGGDTSGLSGTITISGSSTVQPISNLVAELFAEQNPDVQVSVDGPGTSDGFVLFCDGDTDVQDASRAIEEEEIAACEENGVDFVELEVSLDGLTVLTNPANSVECLNTGDLYALFGPESEGFENWSEADALAEQVGGNGGFPDAPLEITAPGEESGTYGAFIELSGIPDTAVENGVKEDDSEALRKDYQASPDDNVIITAMEGTDSALGFVGFAFAEEAGDQVKEIAVDGGDGCVAPSIETVSDGSYPLSRSLYIYVNTGKASGNEALQGYVDLYVSEEGLNTAVEEVGYIPLPTDRQDATRSTWQSDGGA
ncbi:MAG: phosphate ABC transporter substrate-binding protein PstS family protein [Actinomycetota bacterium]